MVTVVKASILPVAEYLCRCRPRIGLPRHLEAALPPVRVLMPLLFHYPIGCAFFSVSPAYTSPRFRAVALLQIYMISGAFL